MTIHQVYVPNLRVERDLQYESGRGERSRWELLHLRQSQLDGACGVHALLMAVAVTARVPRLRLEKLSEATRGPWRAFFQRAKRLHFDGASPKDLQDCAAELPGIQTQRHRPGTALQAYAVCLEAIEAGCVPVVGLDGPAISHWSVAIGCEVRARQPSALLCLDPSKSAPQACFANAWLDLRQSRQPAKGKKLYSYRDNVGGLKLAHVSSVLVVAGPGDIDAPTTGAGRALWK